MRMNRAALSLLSLASAVALGAVPLGSQMTWQGRLLDATGAPVNGNVDLLFTAFDAPVAGDNLGSSGQDGVSVSDGLLTTEVNLPSTIFNGCEVWVEISVDGDILSPRLLMTSAPNAIHAQDAAAARNNLVVSNIGSSGKDGVRIQFDDGSGSGDCSIGLDPTLPGLTVRDPGGLRVSNIGSSGQDGVRIILGDDPDDLCRIFVDPAVAGININDPGGLRVRNLGSSGQDGVATLSFGPTDECRWRVDPADPGMQLLDPNGLRVRNLGSSGQDGVAQISFAGGECRWRVDPADPGMQLLDPSGLRIINPVAANPSILSFGDLGECRLEATPGQGLIVYEPNGLRVRNLGSSGQDGVATLSFGGGECRIEAVPNEGLIVYEADGFTIRNPLPQMPSTLRFGDTGECRIEASPTEGMIAYEPNGVTIRNPDPMLPSTLLFGDTGECRIEAIPQQGLVVYEPNGLRVRNLGSSGQDGVASIALGGGECRWRVDPANPGMELLDPNGMRIVNPDPTGASVLSFGDSGSCRIEAVPGEGMIVYEPNGVLFESSVQIMVPPGGPPSQFGIELNPALGQRGSGFAAQWINASSRRYKDNVRPIDDALTIIEKLQGVRFDWDAAHGGGNDLGFIAEDVGAILPEIVMWEADGVNAKGLDYSRLTSIAVEGIKAQQSELDKLRTENASLRADLDKLQQQMAEVLSQISDAK